MSSAVPQSPVTRVTTKPNPRPRITWSRRDYHERLNLRRIVPRQQPPQIISQAVPRREEVSCDQN